MVDTPAGVLIYQNTFIGAGALFRPGLQRPFPQQPVPRATAGPSRCSQLNTFTNYSDSDYNGFRRHPGAEDSFEWDSPAAGLATDYQGKLEVRRFKTLAEFRAATGKEKHSVLVDYGDLHERAAAGPHPIRSGSTIPRTSTSG